MRLDGLTLVALGAIQSTAAAAVALASRNRDSGLQLRASSAPTGNCSSSTFSSLTLPGSSIFSITAIPRTNASLVSQPPGYPPIAFPPLDLCNVTIIYGHDGWNDTITVSVWMPLTEWNGRLVGAGGGALSTRNGDFSLIIELLSGRAAYATDGGHVIDYDDASSWALGADGKVNYHLLEDFASVSLNDATILSKAVTKAYYGPKPFRTYWNGCSTGGRQGLMLAQKYPTAVDGVLAGAPVINFLNVILQLYWPTIVMHDLKTIPPPCVLDAITNETIKACDSLDSVVDGIIAGPDQCKFNPQSLVGKKVDCGFLGETTITQAQATVVQRIWQGPRSSNGSFIWYGLEPGAPLNNSPISCVGSVDNCTVSTPTLASEIIKYLIYEDPKFDVSMVSQAQFESIATIAQKYNDIIGTSNPDLSNFKAAGGKLIVWHGLADPGIATQGSEDYYQRVERLDPNVQSFFRYFEAPGVNHCVANNPGVASAVSPLDAVIAWVENGTAPETLPARSADGSVSRPLCPYPLVAAYVGGDKSQASSFACRANFTVPGA